MTNTEKEMVDYILKQIGNKAIRELSKVYLNSLYEKQLCATEIQNYENTISALRKQLPYYETQLNVLSNTIEEQNKEIAWLKNDNSAPRIKDLENIIISLRKQVTYYRNQGEALADTVYRMESFKETQKKKLQYILSQLLEIECEILDSGNDFTKLDIALMQLKDDVHNYVNEIEAPE